MSVSFVLLKVARFVAFEIQSIFYCWETDKNIHDSQGNDFQYSACYNMYRLLTEEVAMHLNVYNLQ